MDFNGIWTAIEPYVLGALTALMSGGLIFILVKQILSGWLNRNNLSTLTEQFARSVVGEKIYVDVKALSDKRIAELNEQIKSLVDMTFTKNFSVLKDMTEIVADVGEIFVNSKTVTETQRNKLKCDLEAIRSHKESTAPTDNVVTVNLELNEASKQLINFD